MILGLYKDHNLLRANHLKQSIIFNESRVNVRLCSDFLLSLINILSKNAEPKPLYGTSQVITKTSWLGNWAVRKKESDCTFILLAIRAHC